jgi:hypothetical protein
MQMLVAGEIGAHQVKVQHLRLLDDEFGDGLAARSGDSKRERGLLIRGHRRLR